METRGQVSHSLGGINMHKWGGLAPAFWKAPLLWPRSCGSGREKQALGSRGIPQRSPSSSPTSLRLRVQVSPATSSQPPSCPHLLDALKTWPLGKGLCSRGGWMLLAPKSFCLICGHWEELDA